MLLKVSIIIPVFNRAHLVEETLESIKQQSYPNFECLLVDDGSTDATAEVVSIFTKKDARFQYHKRPYDKPKGANACRNYGLELAQGDYIVFFDSDDFMTPNHLGVKVQAMQTNDIDFVVAQSRYFNNESLNETLKKQYDFNTADITAYNYITHKINWLTIDLCIKSSIAKSIAFNENLQSGQEYNYFSKLILITQNGIFLKEVLTLIRYHEESIRGRLRKDKYETYLSYYFTYWNTYLEIKEKAPKKAKSFLIYRCYRLLCKLPRKERSENAINKAILKEFGLKGFYYILRLYLK